MGKNNMVEIPPKKTARNNGGGNNTVHFPKYIEDSDIGVCDVGMPCGHLIKADTTQGGSFRCPLHGHELTFFHDPSELLMMFGVKGLADAGLFICNICWNGISPMTTENNKVTIDGADDYLCNGCLAKMQEVCCHHTAASTTA